MFLNRRGDWQAWLAALGAAAGWGLLPALTRDVWASGSALSASVFLLLRFAVSFSIFTAWIVMRTGVLPLPALFAALRQRKLPVRIFSAWCAVTAANFWIQTLALAEIPAGLYALIFALHPIVGILMVQTAERGRVGLRGRDAAGLALVLGGALLFLRGCDFGGHLPALWGWLALLGGIATWLTYSTLSRSLHKAGLEPASVTWLTLTIGLIASLPALIHPQAALSTLRQSPALVGCAITAGIVGMFAFALYQHALRLAPRAAFLAQYAEPIAALAAASILLGESVSVGQFGAAFLSLLGLGYLMRSDGQHFGSASPQRQENSICS